MYRDVEEMLTEATQPEVVIALSEYKIEIQLWRLEIGFRGQLSQWNIDRHEVLHSSSRIIHIRIQGYHKTGNSYNYVSVRDRNAILASKYRFLWMPNSTEY